MRRQHPLGAVSVTLVVQAVAIVGNWAMDPGRWSIVAAPIALVLLLGIAVAMSIRPDRHERLAMLGFGVTALALGGELATHLLGTVPALRDPGQELIRSLLILTVLVGSGYAALGPRRGRTTAAAVLGGWAVVTGLALYIDGISPLDEAAEPFALAALVAIAGAVLYDTSTHVADAWAAEAQRAKSVARLAYVDTLTRLPNRRAAEQALARLPRAASALLLLDVDHFKQVNDIHGHDTGDAILRLVGHAIASELRGADTVSRWGGEEFLVILPATDEAGAVRTAERIRARVESTQGPVRVTASVGVAVTHAGEDTRAALERADQALYAAKDAGRNRVALAEPAPERVTTNGVSPVEEVAGEVAVLEDELVGLLGVDARR